MRHDRITSLLFSAVRIVRRRLSPVSRYLTRYLLQKGRHLNPGLQYYLRVVAEADLVIVSGMGGLTDAFAGYAHGLLDTLNLALQWGIPTAMLGQGIGPLRDPELLTRSKEILPHIRLFSLREGRAGPILLKSVGVFPERIIVTGDDAIEAAYQLRAEQLGDGLGLNLRAADYSQVDLSLIECIRPVIQDFAARNDAPLLPIPISRVSGEEDAVPIQQLMTGYPKVIGLHDDFNTQTNVIRQILHCRVVVTGSYHAAVFALATGIPAVCLAKSEYYVDKFLGLAELFPTGCQVVLVNDPHLSLKLQNAIQRMWESAEQVRPSLLKAAEEQIQLSHTAYQRLYNIAYPKLWHKEHEWPC
jgi:colanic acid/amylovoran biosynthesis protein